MILKVDKNIPIPLKNKNRGCGGADMIRQTLVKMEVGDSVYLKDKTLYGYFGNAKKGLPVDLKFKSFREGTGWRVWRVK